MNEVEIQLNERPDGLGFFRGTARRGDTVVHVNILPPERLWAG